MNFRDEIGKITNTTLFLVRGLGLGLPELKKVGFINAYIDDLQHEPHYERSVYCLFRPKEMAEFQVFMTQEQVRTALLIEDYDYEGGYVVLVYSFPKQYLREYEHFENGEFSKFRKSYKDMFPKDREVRNALGSVIKKEHSLYFHVFNRTPELKEFWESEIGVELDEKAEVWTLPSKEKETLNIDLIKLKNELV